MQSSNFDYSTRRPAVMSDFVGIGQCLTPVLVFLL